MPRRHTPVPPASRGRTALPGTAPVLSVLLALLAPAALWAQSLSITPTSQDFGSVCTNAVPTAQQTYTLSGVALAPATATVMVTPSGAAGVGISLSPGGPFDNAPVSVNASGGNLANTSIYVRYNTVAAGANTATLTVSGGGAPDQTATAMATGLDAAPALTVGATPATVCDGGGGENSILAATYTATVTFSGTATNSAQNQSPLTSGGSAGGHRKQYSYPAGSFPAGTRLYSLALDVTVFTGTGPTLGNLSIRLVNSNTNLNGGYIDNGLVEVFSAASYVPIVGLNTFEFSLPGGFLCDGQNVVVDICYSPIANTGQIVTVRFTSTNIGSYYTGLNNASFCNGTRSSGTQSTNGALPTAVFRTTPEPTAISWNPMTYLGTPSSSLGSSTVIATPPPGGPYVYTATATAPGGCTSTGSVSVTVLNTPPANAGTGGTVDFCPTDAPADLFAVLTGSPTAGGTWSGPGVLGGGHLGTFTPGTSTAGTYTYTVTAPPCPNEATATVTVNVKAPAPALTMSAVPATICDGGGATLEATYTPEPVTISWSPMTYLGTPGNTSGSSTVTATPPPGGPYVYTATATTPGGCTSTGSASVTVLNIPAPSAGVGGSLDFCPTDSPANLFAVLTGSPAAGGTWTGPDGQAHSGTFTPGTSTAGAYTYTVSAPPCPDATATLSVYVKAPPPALTMSATPATICIGGISTLAATYTPTVTFSGTATNSAQNFSPLTSGGGAGGHRKQYSYPGASFPAGTRLYSITLEVTARTGSGPTLGDLSIRLANSNTNLNGGYLNSGLTEVYFIASYVPIVGLNTFEFGLPDGFLCDGQNVVVDICYGPTANTGQIVTVRFTSTNIGSYYTGLNNIPFCNGTRTSGTQSANGALPTAIFRTAPDPTIISWSPMTHLGTPNNTPGSGTVTATPPLGGPYVYTATATGPNGCTTTGSVTVTVDPGCTVGIEEPQGPMTVRWLGQDTDGSHLLHTGGDALLGWEALDLSGRVVGQGGRASGGNPHRIGLKNAPNGAYLLRVRTDQGVATVRLVHARP